MRPLQPRLAARAALCATRSPRASDIPVLWCTAAALLFCAARAATQNPVSFSVDGPVDPHTEGIGYPRGTPAAGLPIWAGVRVPAVATATGLPTPLPGDVFDHALFGVPSGAVLFQSPPLSLAMVDPDGTNNQVLIPEAIGLAAGPPVPEPEWLSTEPLRDNVDALSFGEDYFPAISLADTAFLPSLTPWELRGPLFPEPVVVDDGGVSFRFDVDPWAVGLAGTDVASESTGVDAGAGFIYVSPGAAAGDVFGTPLLMKVGGVAFGVSGPVGSNALDHDQTTLGLAPTVAPLFPAEDDVDALECDGDNTVPDWSAGALGVSGDLLARVFDDPGFPGLAPPGVLSYLPVNTAPVFFSVTRSSPGLPGTAVRTQFVFDGGAAADIFVAVIHPLTGEPANLLFIDNKELGLYSPIAGTGSDDVTDDLDALILWVDPHFRPIVDAAIATILASIPPPSLAPPDGFPGPGMTVSVTKLIGAIPHGAVRVGFSVTTDSIGMEFTAVDYEAGLEPFSTAAGDVFYAEPTGSFANTNYLWYDAADLGLDEGAWVSGASADLAELADNLNGLDSIDVGLGCPGTVVSYGAGCPGASGVVPVASLTGCPAPGETVTFVVDGAAGGVPAVLIVGASPASIPLGAGCTLLVSPLVGLPPIATSAAGSASFSVAIPPGPTLSGLLLFVQWAVIDPGAPGPAALTNALTVTIG